MNSLFIIQQLQDKRFAAPLKNSPQRGSVLKRWQNDMGNLILYPKIKN